MMATTSECRKQWNGDSERDFKKEVEAIAQVPENLVHINIEALKYFHEDVKMFKQDFWQELNTLTKNLDKLLTKICEVTHFQDRKEQHKILSSVTQRIEFLERRFALQTSEYLSEINVLKKDFHNILNSVKLNLHKLESALKNKSQ